MGAFVGVLILCLVNGSGCIQVFQDGKYYLSQDQCELEMQGLVASIKKNIANHYKRIGYGCGTEMEIKGANI